jgi:hypothetical protein
MNLIETARKSTQKVKNYSFFFSIIYVIILIICFYFMYLILLFRLHFLSLFFILFSN